jgi:hypothetical protein
MRLVLALDQELSAIQVLVKELNKHDNLVGNFTTLVLTLKEILSLKALIEL